MIPKREEMSFQLDVRTPDFSRRLSASVSAEEINQGASIEMSREREPVEILWGQEFWRGERRFEPGPEIVLTIRLRHVELRSEPIPDDVLNIGKDLA